MQALKNVGPVLAGIAGLLVFVFLATLYIAGLAWVSANVYEYLNIGATIAFVVCVFILLPCALFRPTRKFSVYGLFISSVIFGASTWIFGFLVTFQYWGGIGVFFGVIMGVVGIMPLGMLASGFHSDWAAFGMLALGLVLTFGARMIAVMLAAWIDGDEAGFNSNSPSESSEPQLSRQALVTACVLGLVLAGSVGVWLAGTQRTVTKDPGYAQNQKKPARANPTDQAVLLGQFGEWGAYKATPGGKKICFALAKPTSATTVPADRSRDPSYAFISTRPAEKVKNEVSVIVGYPQKPGQDATAAIGLATYAMYTQNDVAWVKSAAEEPQIVEAMRRGGDLEVKSQSARGTKTTDTYSLKSIAQALDKVAEECR